MASDGASEATATALANTPRGLKLKPERLKSPAVPSPQGALGVGELDVYPPGVHAERLGHEFVTLGLSEQARNGARRLGDERLSGASASRATLVCIFSRGIEFLRFRWWG